MDFSEICGDFGLIVAGDRDRSGLLSPFSRFEVAVEIWD